MPYFGYKKKLRRAKAIERGLKMVPVLIHLPPPSSDTQGANRDLREVMREKTSQAEVLYNLLAGTATEGFQSKFYGQRHLALELVASGGLVHFYAAVPVALLSVVKKAVLTAYPGARLEEVEDHNIFNQDGRLAATMGGEMILRAESAYPIATYEKLERDPMEALLTTLTALGPKDGAAVQLMVRPASPTWTRKSVALADAKRKGRAHNLSFSAQDLVKAAIKAPDARREEERARLGGAPDVSNLELSIIEKVEEKTKHPGFEILIRVVVSTESVAHSQQLLRDISTAFALFDAPGSNGFRFLPALDVQGLVTAFIFRFFPPELASNVLNSVELATMFHLPDSQFTPSSSVERQHSKQVDGPVQLPTVGLLFGYNEFRGVRKEIRLSVEDRRRHTYILGQTGTGKSTMLENLAVQDMVSGNGFAFIDPHGDSAEKLLAMVPKERAEDVIYFNPADTEYPLGLNLFEFNDPTQKDFIVQETINMLYKLYDPGHTGIIGPRYEHWYRNAALTLMSDPNGSTFIEIPKVFTDTEYLKKKFRYLRDPTVIDFWTKEMGQTSDYHKSEMLGWFVSKFGAFQNNEMMRNIIGQTHSSFNLREVMDNKKILIVNLSKGRVGELNSQLLGMIFVIKFQAAAMSRAEVPEDQRADFCLYVDEFQNFSTDSFASILSEARKYRLNLIVANQFIGQLRPEIRDAVFGNIGTIVAHRMGPEDAEFMQKQFAPVFDVTDLVNLPNFNAGMRLMSGGLPSQPFSIVDSPPLGKPNLELGLAVKQLSAAKFGRTKAVVEAEIFDRLSGREAVGGAVAAGVGAGAAVGAGAGAVPGMAAMAGAMGAPMAGTVATAAAPAPMMPQASAGMAVAGGATLPAAPPAATPPPAPAQPVLQGMATAPPPIGAPPIGAPPIGAAPVEPAAPPASPPMPAPTPPVPMPSTPMPPVPLPVNPLTNSAGQPMAPAQVDAMAAPVPPEAPVPLAAPTPPVTPDNVPVAPAGGTPRDPGALSVSDITGGKPLAQAVLNPADVELVPAGAEPPVPGAAAAVAPPPLPSPDTESVTPPGMPAPPQLGTGAPLEGDPYANINVLGDLTPPGPAVAADEGLDAENQVAPAGVPLPNDPYANIDVLGAAPELGQQQVGPQQAEAVLGEDQSDETVEEGLGPAEEQAAESSFAGAAELGEEGPGDEAAGAEEGAPLSQLAPEPAIVPATAESVGEPVAAQPEPEPSAASVAAAEPMIHFVDPAAAKVLERPTPELTTAEDLQHQMEAGLPEGVTFVDQTASGSEAAAPAAAPSAQPSPPPPAPVPQAPAPAPQPSVPATPPTAPPPVPQAPPATVMGGPGVPALATPLDKMAVTPPPIGAPPMAAPGAPVASVPPQPAPMPPPAPPPPPAPAPAAPEPVPPPAAPAIPVSNLSLAEALETLPEAAPPVPAQLPVPQSQPAPQPVPPTAPSPPAPAPPAAPAPSGGQATAGLESVAQMLQEAQTNGAPAAGPAPAEPVIAEPPKQQPEVKPPQPAVAQPTAPPVVAAPPAVAPSAVPAPQPAVVQPVAAPPPVSQQIEQAESAIDQVASSSLIHEDTVSGHRRLPEPVVQPRSDEDEGGIDLEMNSGRAEGPQPVATASQQPGDSSSEHHHGLKVIQPLEPIVPPKEQFARELAALNAEQAQAAQPAPSAKPAKHGRKAKKAAAAAKAAAEAAAQQPAAAQQLAAQQTAAVAQQPPVPATLPPQQQPAEIVRHAGAMMGVPPPPSIEGVTSGDEFDLPQAESLAANDVARARAEHEADQKLHPAGAGQAVVGAAATPEAPQKPASQPRRQPKEAEAKVAAPATERPRKEAVVMPEAPAPKRKRRRRTRERPAPVQVQGEQVASAAEAEHNRPTEVQEEAKGLTGKLILPSANKPAPEPAAPKLEKPKKLAPGEVFVDENGNVMVGE